MTRAPVVESGATRVEVPSAGSTISLVTLTSVDAVTPEVPDDLACQRARGEVGTGDKTHQRTKTLGGGSTKKMQARHGRLEAGVEDRITVECLYRSLDLPGQERIA